MGTWGACRLPLSNSCAASHFEGSTSPESCPPPPPCEVAPPMLREALLRAAHQRRCRAPEGVEVQGRCERHVQERQGRVCLQLATDNVDKGGQPLWKARASTCKLLCSFARDITAGWSRECSRQLDLLRAPALLPGLLGLDGPQAELCPPPCQGPPDEPAGSTSRRPLVEAHGRGVFVSVGGSGCLLVVSWACKEWSC